MTARTNYNYTAYESRVQRQREERSAYYQQETLRELSRQLRDLYPTDEEFNEVIDAMPDCGTREFNALLRQMIAHRRVVLAVRKCHAKNAPSLSDMLYALPVLERDNYISL